MIRHTQTRAIGRVVAAFALALVVGASGVAGNPQANALELAPVGSRGGPSLIDIGAGLLSIVPRPIWEALGQAQTIDNGTDGVFTVLLLGSDARSGGTSRTDTIMVVSVKNNVIRAASIPRDTAKILDPFTQNENDTFKGRVNAIIKKLKNKHNGNTAAALADLETVIEYNLGLEIDEHALITFNGFHWMVDVVDPITIDISNQIKDTGYWDDPSKPKGVYFPAQNNYELWTWQRDAAGVQTESQLCNGLWKTQGTANQNLWCRRAMPYVRSRKGSGNSDFKRAKRQQEFVAATIEEVQQDGWATVKDALVTAAQGQDAANQLYTSFEINAANVQDIWSKVATAQLGEHLVFQPKKYSTHIPGTTAYQLKLIPVRAWVDACLEFKPNMSCPPS